MFRGLWRDRWRPPPKPPKPERWRVPRQGFKRNPWTEFAVVLIMLAATLGAVWWLAKITGDRIH